MTHIIQGYPIVAVCDENKAIKDGVWNQTMYCKNGNIPEYPKCSKSQKALFHSLDLLFLLLYETENGILTIDCPSSYLLDSTVNSILSFFLSFIFYLF